MNQRRIAVIGAGVLGATLAHHLTERGADGTAGGTQVTLLDRDEPGRGTSHWSLGWVNSNGKTPRAYHDLTVYAMSAWARLAERASGDAWYRPVGNLRWAADAAGRRRLEERVAHLRNWDYRAETVGPERVRELAPGARLPEDVDQAAWFPDEGFILTEPLIASLVWRAERAGAEVRTGAAGQVIAVDRGGADGEWVLATRDGGRLTVDTVVSCTGRWTPEVTGLAGAEVPIVDPEPAGSTAPGLVVRAGPAPEPLTRVLHTPRVHIRPHGRAGEQVHLEAADIEVDLHTSEAELDSRARVLLERARRVLPSLAGADVISRKVCVRPLPTDGLPVLGRTGDGSGPYVVLTHSGVTLAAGLAELVSGELLEERPAELLEPFRPRRLGGPHSAARHG